MELLRIAFLVAVSALVGLSSSAPAGAQGLKDNLTAPESNWTGFYLGAGGGLNSLVSEVDAKPGSAVSSDPVSQVHRLLSMD